MNIPMNLENRYQIISIVKSGAMGCVYKAKDTRLDNIVAVKQMFSSFTNIQDQNYAEKRFREEGNILSHLHHGGLPKVIDFFVIKDAITKKNIHYLVMTYIEGKDLETIIEESSKKPFPIDEALNYFHQILDILIYLHSQKPPIIYRDLKPSNIMVQNNKIFLVDFGIARIFNPLQRGTAIGTPGFAPPEQYKGSSEPRSDLYSLGAVMHYLLTGKDPADSSNILFHFDQPIKINRNIPIYLDKIIKSMLDLVPNKRPPSAQTVKELLSVGPTQIKIFSPGKKSSKGSPTKTKQTKPKYKNIFEAIDKNDVDAVKRRVNVNTTNRYGETALYYAAEKGAKEIVEVLLNKGADINEKSTYKETPLHIALKKGHKEIAELLISKGAKIDATKYDDYLYSAIERGCRDLVELLVSLGANIFKHKDSSFGTYLHQAAWKGYREIVELLIAKGIDVNVCRCNGETPLHLSAMHGNYEVTELLISKGANVNAKTSGRTPLHFAALEGKDKIVELLISKGADVNAMGFLYTTPLDEANTRSQHSTVQLLRKYGAKKGWITKLGL